MIVSLKTPDDEAIRGVLWTTRGRWFILKECDGLKRGEAPEHLRGETLIHRDNVAFVQVLP